MSYILDALRKADAQRSRDPALGIHAQPAAVGTGVPGGHRRRERWIGAGAAALTLGLWWWLAPATAPPRAVSAPRVAPAPAAVPAPVAPATVLLPPPQSVVVAAAKAPVAAAPAPVAAPATAAPAAAAAAASGPAPTPAPAAEAAATPAAQRTYSLAELPAGVQQALPKFSVSGGVYSTNVAQRMLVVNGQVFNEGSEIAPGVVLEQIRPRVALLKFRGLRISQPY